MRLKWWESFALAIPLLVGLFFLAGRLWLPGTVLVALTAFTGASRAHIVERNIAGYHARTRAALLAIRWLALFVIYVGITVLLFVMQQQHWVRDTHGLVAVYATSAVAFFLTREIWRLGNESNRWWIGSAAEERVAAALDQLRDHGWMVVHNLDRDGRGNVDHFVTGPAGAYAIETKSGRHRAADRGQTISNAVWAKEKFAERWVTPVLCVGTDPPAQPTMLRHGNASLWVLGPGQLTEWMLAQPARPR
jgi:hypothetical protein